ncbi:MAG: hypothetical protein V4692_13210, partial [Bdellovibrionota bacterium]
MKQLMIKFITILRALIGAVIGIALTAVSSLAVIIAGALKKDRALSWIARRWGIGLLYIFGIRVEVKGAENIPAEGGAI